jgi:serine/threonine-protein kinase RsbW
MLRSRRFMATSETRTVRLEIASRLELLETVQAVLTHLAGLMGFDEDATHYMSVALRESVVNAIKHGNRQDPREAVRLEFVLAPPLLTITVADQGQGFDVGKVADPLAEENLLKADGRGIFFMRSFMDEIRYEFPPTGGTQVSMVKRLGGPQSPWIHRAT